jgi:hypothetical protein
VLIPSYKYTRTTKQTDWTYDVRVSSQLSRHHQRNSVIKQFWYVISMKICQCIYHCKLSTKPVSLSILDRVSYFSHQSWRYSWVTMTTSGILYMKTFCSPKHSSTAKRQNASNIYWRWTRMDRLGRCVKAKPWPHSHLRTVWNTEHASVMLHLNCRRFSL